MKRKAGFQNRLSALFTHPSTNTSIICLDKYKKIYVLYGLVPVLFFCSKDILHSYTTQIITLSNIVNIHEDIDIQVTTDLLENDQSLKMGYLL